MSVMRSTQNRFSDFSTFSFFLSLFSKRRDRLQSAADDDDDVDVDDFNEAASFESGS